MEKEGCKARPEPGGLRSQAGRLLLGEVVHSIEGPWEGEGRRERRERGEREAKAKGAEAEERREKEEEEREGEGQREEN